MLTSSWTHPMIIKPSKPEAVTLFTKPPTALLGSSCHLIVLLFRSSGHTGQPGVVGEEQTPRTADTAAWT